MADPSSVSGIYSDPNHPAGYRVVRSVNGFPFALTLQDEPDGPIVSCDGSWREPGVSLALDLSNKGGPKDVEARVGPDRLVFPDGNAWTKLPGPDGVYSDPFHPEGYRTVRIVDGGATMRVSLQDEPGGRVVELVGHRDEKGDYQTDFSPKGYHKTLAATVGEGKIHFPDGNAWVKY